MNKNKGAVFVLVVFVVLVLVLLGTALVSQSISESRLAKKYSESIQAFWLAEAGINRALDELRLNYYQSGTGLWTTTLDTGEYSVDVVIESQDRRVIAYGFVPSIAQASAVRRIEVVMNKDIPPGFYDYALYSAGDIDVNGDAYNIQGDIIYADDWEVDHPENIIGTVTAEPTITPLARFDFQELRDISEIQGNIYTVSPSGKLIDPDTGEEKALPSSFWSPWRDDGIDNDGDGAIDENDEQINIAYIEGDLQLNGNIGSVGGFLVVVGDVITDPDDTQDTTINGNGLIDGVIYTRGTFRVNGGGEDGLNVDGGVWAGDLIRLNGSVDIAYNAEYMGAIGSLNLGGDVQVISWKDPQTSYPLVP